MTYMMNAGRAISWQDNWVTDGVRSSGVSRVEWVGVV